MLCEISEFFGEFSEIIPKSLEKGRILRINIDEQKDVTAFVVALGKPVAYEVVKEFEKRLAKALNLTTVVISCRYAPDVLNADFFPELVKYLKEKTAVVNGFFDGATADYSGGVFTIHLTHGGLDLLKKANADGIFSQIVGEMFSVNVAVEFDGVVVSDAEEQFQIFLSPP